MQDNILIPYSTINNSSEIEQIINKSRFIGRAFHVTDECLAGDIIASIKKQNYDATHNCYAYVLDQNHARYSDDGEPQGTAGMPILEVIRAKKLSYTLCVITRYFGGILLGAGGLVRAYSGSCAQALNAADVVHAAVGTELNITVPYKSYGAIELCIKSNSQVINIDFLENIRIVIHVKRERCEELIKSIIDLSGGKACVQIGSDVTIIDNP